MIDKDLQWAIAAHSADKTVCYKKVEGMPVYLGYFFPEEYDAHKKYPAFLMIHGGGWSANKVFEDQSGWQGDYLGYLARYYSHKGYIGISIDYRLIRDGGQMPGYGIDDSVQDCMDAVSYIQEHAARYGIDVQRMYLLGESAGGHLAGAVATFEGEHKYSFRKAFLVNPITDVTDPVWQAFVSKAEGSLQKHSEALSPLYHVRPGIGDVVLFHGTEDITVDPGHSQKFYQRMKACGNSCELHMLQGAEHAFLLPEYYADRAACKETIRIIDNVLEEDQ